MALYRHHPPTHHRTFNVSTVFGVQDHWKPSAETRLRSDDCLLLPLSRSPRLVRYKVATASVNTDRVVTLAIFGVNCQSTAPSVCHDPPSPIVFSQAYTQTDSCPSQREKLEPNFFHFLNLGCFLHRTRRTPSSL